MNRIQLIFLCLICLGLIACGDDDDTPETTGPTGPSFSESCCANPPIDTIVNGINIFVPNAISANGDGINDVFAIFATEGLARIKKLVIGSNIPQVELLDVEDVLVDEFSWDGTDLDGNLEAGVFVYSIFLEDEDGNEIVLQDEICVRTGGLTLPCVDNEGNCGYGIQYSVTTGYNPNLDTFEACE